MQWRHNLPHLGWKKFQVVQLFPVFKNSKNRAKIISEKGEGKEFSIVVDSCVAMKFANFHIKGSKDSWDKRKKLAFPGTLKFKIKNEWLPLFSLMFN